MSAALHVYIYMHFRYHYGFIVCTRIAPSISIEQNCLVCRAPQLPAIFRVCCSRLGIGDSNQVWLSLFTDPMATLTIQRAQEVPHATSQCSQLQQPFTVLPLVPSGGLNTLSRGLAQLVGELETTAQVCMRQDTPMPLSCYDFQCVTST